MNGVVSRRRRVGIGRLSTYVGLALAAAWALFAAGAKLLWIAAAVGAVVVTAIRIRRNRPLLLSIVTAALTTALTAAAALWMMQQADADSQAAAGVLTGFVLASPIPAALAWLWPPDLGHRHILSAAGSLVLLLGAAVPLITSRPTGAAAILLIALIAIGAGFAAYHRRQQLRCARTCTQTSFGWTDLGSRSLSDGSTARLLYHRGALMVCVNTTTVTGRSPTRRAMRTALTAAADLRINPSRTQPVLLFSGHDRTTVSTTSTTVDTQTSTVRIAHPAALGLAAEGAPHRRLARRYPTAAVLLTGQATR